MIIVFNDHRLDQIEFDRLCISLWSDYDLIGMHHAWTFPIVVTTCRCNVGKTIINHPFGNGNHTTYLWWNWGWFNIVLPTLPYFCWLPIEILQDGCPDDNQILFDAEAGTAGNRSSKTHTWLDAIQRMLTLHVLVDFIWFHTIVHNSSKQENTYLKYLKSTNVCLLIIKHGVLEASHVWLPEGRLLCNPFPLILNIPILRPNMYVISSTTQPWFLGDLYCEWGKVINNY